MVAYTGGDSMDGDNFPEVRYKVTADAALTERSAARASPCRLWSMASRSPTSVMPIV